MDRRWEAFLPFEKLWSALRCRWRCFSGTSGDYMEMGMVDLLPCHDTLVQSEVEPTHIWVLFQDLGANSA
ncbi:hypothetical protein Y590_24290 [Methylobacterium sp. AMS5]|nr:hypothetical protein Y590_24290 [Methylobacterium sp. AMS5]